MRFSLGNILRLRRFDWVLFLLVALLVAISLSTIYSVDLSLDTKLSLVSTQLLALVIGVVVFFVASILHESFFHSSAKLAYLISALSLVLVLFLGISIRGTRGWFNFFGFSFQPAELAKVGLILFLAWWMEKNGRRFDRYQFIITSGFFAFLLAVLILLQPDLGSALIIGTVWFGLLCLSGVKKRYIAFLVSILVLGVVSGWFFVLQDYQKDRLLTYVNPAHDPLGAGYNVQQSIIAIGSGNLVGRGLGFGSQSQLHFLPEAQTDFIFATIAEELGFVGSGIILLLYFFLLWRLLIIAKRASSDFASYTVLGILLLFFSQIIINIGGASGFLPVTGVTLPFLSYGGSSLIINFFLLGIAESITRSCADLDNIL